MRPGRSLDHDGLDGILSLPTKPKSKSVTLLFLLGIGLISTAMVVVGFWQKSQSQMNVAQVQTVSSAPQAKPIVAVVAPESLATPPVASSQSYDIVPNQDDLQSADATVKAKVDNKINDTGVVGQSNPVAAQMPVDGTSKAESKVLFTVRFTLDSIHFNAISKSATLELIELAKHCANKIIVLGHTCNLGNDASNMRLGLARAGALKKMLTAHGLPGDHILIASAGMEKPVVSNASKSGQALNRRAELYCSTE